MRREIVCLVALLLTLSHAAIADSEAERPATEARAYNIGPLLPPTHGITPLEQLFDPQVQRPPVEVPPPPQRPPHRAKALEKIEDHVRATVGEPHEWAGDDPLYTMTERSNSLIIRTTPQGHAQVERALREAGPGWIDLTFIGAALTDEDFQYLQERLADYPQLEVETPAGETAPQQAILVDDLDAHRLHHIVTGSRESASFHGLGVLDHIRAGRRESRRAGRRYRYIGDYQLHNGQWRPRHADFVRGVHFDGGGFLNDDRSEVELHFRLTATAHTGPTRENIYPKSSPDQPMVFQNPRYDQQQMAGKVTVPDGATLVLIGQPITGTFLTGRDVPADDDPRWQQQRRVVVILQPTVTDQHRR